VTLVRFEVFHDGEAFSYFLGSGIMPHCRFTRCQNPHIYNLNNVTRS
jgi:hypothetical protein